MAASHTFEQFAIQIDYYNKCGFCLRKMQQYSFCDKNCANFGIKLDAEISIWMQSKFDGFVFSAKPNENNAELSELGS